MRFVAPEIGGKRTEFLLQFEGAVGIVDCRHDLAAMTHNAGILHQTLNVFVSKCRHFLDVKPGEGSAKILALAQDCQPGQAGLEPLKAQFFKQPCVIGNRMSPFMVMIFKIAILIAVPPAPCPSVFTKKQTCIPAH